MGVAYDSSQIMHAVYLDAPYSDDERRVRLYQGQLFMFSPRPAVVALRDFTRRMIEEAFAPLDPRTAQFRMPVEQYVAILANLKPAFIHHPTCKDLLRQILREQGCDLEQIYFDVPRLRTSTAAGYLTAGIAYAFHPHRDTWYSAPQCQLNWWFPVYEIEPNNGMAFHPRYWSQGVANSSHIYNYDRWNAESRQTAAQHIHTDTRPQPHALLDRLPHGSHRGRARAPRGAQRRLRLHRDDVARLSPWLGPVAHSRGARGDVRHARPKRRVGARRRQPALAAAIHGALAAFSTRSRRLCQGAGSLCMANTVLTSRCSRRTASATSHAYSGGPPRPD